MRFSVVVRVRADVGVRAMDSGDGVSYGHGYC